jgi:hypothetical protein
MSLKDYTILTADEAALLPIAARLDLIVKAYAALPPLSEQMQDFWNQKVALELVRYRSLY